MDLDEINALLRTRFRGKQITKLIRGSDLPPAEFISTGILKLDWALSGGVSPGHVYEFYGRRSSGKTTTTLKIISQLQMAGRKVAMFLLEPLDSDWAKLMKVKMDELYIYMIESDEPAELVLEVALEMLRQGFDVVIDSIAFLVPSKKLKGTLEDKHYCGIADVLTSFFEKAIGQGIIRKNRSILILINQIRQNIGVQYGPRIKTPGGECLQHSSSVRIHFEQGDAITIGAGDEVEHIGREIKFVVVKNKIRRPNRFGSYQLYFSAGVNPLKDVLEMAKYYDLVEMNGSHWYYPDKASGVYLGNGEKQHVSFLIENPDIYKNLREEIRNIILEGKR